MWPRSFWDIGGVDQDLQIWGFSSGVEAISASALGLPPEFLAAGGGLWSKSLTFNHNKGLQIWVLILWEFVFSISKDGLKAFFLQKLLFLLNSISDAQKRTFSSS